MRKRITFGALPCLLAVLCLLGLAACGGETPSRGDGPAGAAPTLDGAVKAAFAGDVDAARKAFAALAAGASAEATPRLWLAVLGGDTAGLATFAEGEGFEAALARWAAGAREQDVLMMAAGSVEDDAARAAARTRARFYLGLAAEQAGDNAAAQKNYEAAVTRDGQGVPELGWAKQRLAALKGA